MSGKGRAVVFIVDDDISVREALVPLMRWAGFEARGFESGEAFLAAERPACAACLILDLQLPGLDGLDIQQLIRSAQDILPIIFISAHADVPHSVRAMKGGALEFLTKPFEEERLLNAVHAAIERSEAARRQATALDGVRERYASLTPREREVMTLVVGGLLNKQIAGRLGTSEITVKVHRRQVMQKMAATSLADLVRSAAAIGVDLPGR